jgi:alpha-beta hydrolase superfamily lysophospholipase
MKKRSNSVFGTFSIKNRNLLLCALLAAATLFSGRSYALTDDEFISEVQAFHSQELSVVESPEDATRFRIQRDQEGHILHDRPVVILIHGLYNSPTWMNEQENLDFQRGAHVINLRLPGHFEKNRRSLDFTKSEEWVAATNRALQWATSLGTQISVVGHSVGAVLAMKLAAENPTLVKKLALFSPALKVDWKLRTQLNVTTALGLSAWVQGIPTGEERYCSTWAGSEAVSFSNTLARTRLTDGSAPHFQFEAVVNALKSTEILWVDTASEATLSLKMNEDVSKKFAASQQHFQRIVIDKNLAVLHKNTAALTGEAGNLLVQPYLHFLGLESGRRPNTALNANSCLGVF